MEQAALHRTLGIYLELIEEEFLFEKLDCNLKPLDQNEVFDSGVAFIIRLIVDRSRHLTEQIDNEIQSKLL